MNTVSILDYEYKTEDKELIAEFKKLAPNFELDDFQKHAVEKIRNSENVLVTANTGCGKTKCMEYGIIDALNKNKKCIITSPIKALSNQKFYEFKKKFKGVASVGIFTGDIKYNPDADIIIMTAEILRNLLYKKSYESQNIQYKLDININIDEDVRCVVMDEAHYINDESRGKVWEETLTLLPPHINLVLLSATIGNADHFAKWLSEIKNKPCHWIPKKERVIPLTHYLYYSTRNPKKGDTSITNMIMKKSNKLVELVNSNEDFNENTLDQFQAIKRANDKLNNTYTNRKVVVNNVLKHLQKKKLLPALFFIFSRKQCEEYAHCVELCFNTKQEQTRVEKLINNNIHRLYNKDIYLKSNEYLELKNLLMKGIAYHHSGMRTVFKEIIEMLCNEGLVKVLFATETFAVGINAPIKTVLFTSLQKYSNEGHRYLNTAEYKQMAGRAGRRGLDKVGTVVLLTNLIDMPVAQQLKGIMCGNSANISSRFSLNYQFILKIILSEYITFESFLKNTLMNKEASVQRARLLRDIEEQKQRISKLPQTQITTEEYDRYYDIKERLYGKVKTTKGEKKYVKKIEATGNFEDDYNLYLANYEEYNYLNKLQYELDNWKDSTTFDLELIINMLAENDYIKMEEGQDYKTLTKENVTLKGILASQINETNELLMTELITKKYFDRLNEEEICGMLGVFLHTTCLSDEMKTSTCDNLDIPRRLKKMIKHMENLNHKLEESETKMQIFMDTNWELNYDMIEYMYKWCSGVSFKNLYFDNYVGNFIKDVLKLSNILDTMEILASIVGNTNLVQKIQNIKPRILRDCVSNESLYIKI